MFNIKDEIQKMIVNKPLSCDDRFALINVHGVSRLVNEYLSERLSNLSICIDNCDSRDILFLMKKGLLEGYCWQTTETSIVFFDDLDYIERGNLTFDEDTLYYHSWISFSFKNKNYVFDPSLNILCDKKLYYDIFEVRLKSRVSARKVRNAFLESIKNSSVKNRTCAYNLVRSEFGIEININNGLCLVQGNDDVSSPMFRNDTVYNAVIDDKNVRKLDAYYYKKADDD